MPDDTGREGAGRGGIVLGAGEAAARLIAFVASLIVAHRLGPGLFGIVGVTSGIMLYLTQLADQGIELVGVPFVAGDPAFAQQSARATLTFRVIGALLLAAVVAPVSIMLLPDPDGRILARYLPALVLSAASARWILLGVRRPASVAAARIAGELVALALVAAFVRASGDLTLVPLAAVAGLGVTTVAMLAASWRSGFRLMPSLAWGAVRELFARGRPLVAFTLLGLVLFNFDLLFLRYLKGSEAAGAYAAAYTFIAFASNLLVAYAHGVMPSLTRSATAPSAHVPVYEAAQAQVIALALPAALGSAFVAGALMQLVFGAAFGAGEVALRWLSLSLPFAALREVAVVAVVAGGGEGRLVRVNFVVVVCNVLLNIVLIPGFGLRGAALATLATEVLRLLLVARLASTLGYHATAGRRLVKPVAASLAMLALLQVTGVDPLWRTVAAGVLAYGGVLTVLGGVRFRRGGLPILTL